MSLRTNRAERGHTNLQKVSRHENIKSMVTIVVEIRKLEHVKQVGTYVTVYEKITDCETSYVGMDFYEWRRRQGNQ